MIDSEIFDKVCVALADSNNRVEYVPADEKSLYPMENVKIFDGNTSDVIFSIEHMLGNPYEFIKLRDKNGAELDKTYSTDRDSYNRSQILLNYGINVAAKSEQNSDNMKTEIKRKKDELRKRLVNKKETDKVSGTVVADKIAEAQISGVIEGAVTPERGKKLADSVKRKLISDRQLKR